MADAKVVIKAQNDIKAGLDNAKKDMNEFSGSMGIIGDKLKSALSVAGIAAGFVELGKAAFDCFKEFGEGERRFNQLKIALDTTGGSLSKATQLIDDLSKQTLSSKDDVEKMVAELATLGKSDKDIERISNAAVNLSNVTGQDLNSAFKQVMGTFDGTTGQLEKLVPELGNLSKEQLANGDAADILNKKFSEMSHQLAENDVPQKLKNIQDAWGDLKQNLGQAAAPIFNPLLDGINRIIEGWNRAAKAADLHNQILASSSYTQKIAALQELLQVQKEQLRAKEQEIAGLQKEYEKNKANWPLLVAINEQIKERDKLKTQAESTEAQIIDTKKNWTNTPIFKLNPKDLVSPVELVETPIGSGNKSGTSTTSSASTTEDPLTKSLKSFLEGINTFLQVNENHPGYYSAEAIQSFIKSALGSVYEFETKNLTGEQSEILNDVRTLLQVFESSIQTIAGDTTSLYFKPNVSDEDDAAALEALGELGKRLNENEAVMTFNKEFAQFLIDQFIQENNASKLDALDVIAQGLKNEQMNKDVKDYIATDNLNWFNQQTTVKSSDIADEEWIARFDAEDASKLDALDVIAQHIKEANDKNDAWIKKFDEDDAANLAALDVIAENLKKAEQDKEVKDYIQKDNQDWFIQYRPEKPTTEKENTYSKYTDNMVDKAVNKISSILPAGQGKEALGNISGVLTNSLSSIIDSLGPFGNIIAGMNPALALLSPVIEGFTSVLGPAITEVIDPLMGTLTMIGETLGIALLPILDAISPIFAILASILQAVLLPVIQLLSPIITVVASVFELLTPILKLFAQAIVIVMAPIQFMGDLFTWVATAIKNAVHNLVEFIEHPFNAKKRDIRKTQGFSSDAFTGLQQRLDQIDNIGQTNLAESTNTSTNTAAQSASYSGGNNITINIYQQAPVVGDAGMTEFARMIRNELTALDYYGA